MKLENLQLNFLNQLSSEILILDCDLNIIWLNDSALNRGWFFNKKNVTLCTTSDKKVRPAAAPTTQQAGRLRPPRAGRLGLYTDAPATKHPKHARWLDTFVDIF